MTLLFEASGVADNDDDAAAAAVSSPPHAHGSAIVAPTLLRVEPSALAAAVASARITRAAFCALSRADQARLVGRLINAWRKETGVVGALAAIPDARCPVVRFTLREAAAVGAGAEAEAEEEADVVRRARVAHVELSIENAFGVAKADVLRRFVEADASPTGA